ncbi:HNH endonuclease signature motif containing protein [Leucobacter sp. HY1910]
MEAKPSPQHEEPLAGLFTEAASEGADAGTETATADATSGLGMQAKCDEIVQLMAHVQALFPADCPGADARTVVNALTDEGAIDFAKIVAQVMRKFTELQVLSAGAVGTRSAKRAGQPGVAQASGFKTSVEMMQHLTGSSWGEASRKVRVGESILTGETAEREALEQREALAAKRALEASASDAEGHDDDGGSTALETAAAEAELVLAVPWHSVLDRAVSRDLLTDPQNDAIRQGLGTPPRTPAPNTPAVGTVADGAAVAPACAFHTAAYAALHASGHSPTPTVDLFDDGDCGGRCEAALLVLWWQAGLDLIEAAQHTRVEELRRHARAIRDLLDPEGATLRRNERYEARSFRWWTDPNGQFHARLTCDDDAGAWIQTIFASALRPRRGGPRFIDPAEQAAGEELAQDERTHHQISHDLLIDLLQSGAVADQQTVFGTRQVGVRVVQVVNRAEYLAEQAEARAAETASKAAKAAKKALRQTASGATPEAQQPSDTQTPAAQPPADPVGVVAWYEDGLTITSDSVVAKQRCNAGVVHVTVDEDYNPLDVGREQRLYNGAQRIALATRDGGCRWPGCDRPSSYCEAHHIDHWHSDQGRTDIDRGIALCALCRRRHNLHYDDRRIMPTRDTMSP